MSNRYTLIIEYTSSDINSNVKFEHCILARFQWTNLHLAEKALATILEQSELTSALNKSNADRIDSIYKEIASKEWFLKSVRMGDPLIDSSSVNLACAVELDSGDWKDIGVEIWSSDTNELTKASVFKVERDDCEICLGERGGIKGNENIIDGQIVCDYCSVDCIE
jgi:hypothetical protein